MQKNERTGILIFSLLPPPGLSENEGKTVSLSKFTSLSAFVLSCLGVRT